MDSQILKRMLRVSFLGFLLLWTAGVRAQDPGAPERASDPLEQRVPRLKLEDEPLLTGIARLNTLTKDVGFSVELIPGTPTSAPPPSPKFTAQIEGAAVQEVLDWLCGLDRRYAWARDGNMVNVFPRAIMHDTNYFLNRKLTNLVLHEVSKPMDAVSKATRPISRPGETLVSWQGIHDFSKPWTASFTNISVREALNRIAQQLGPGYGWLVAGNPEVRIFSFHQQLRPRLNSQE